jgi:hypothetical protein
MRNRPVLAGPLGAGDPAMRQPHRCNRDSDAAGGICAVQTMSFVAQDWNATVISLLNFRAAVR